jgi:hypothetical protein
VAPAANAGETSLRVAVVSVWVASFISFRLVWLCYRTENVFDGIGKIDCQKAFTLHRIRARKMQSIQRFESCSDKPLHRCQDSWRFCCRDVRQRLPLLNLVPALLKRVGGILIVQDI